MARQDSGLERDSIQRGRIRDIACVGNRPSGTFFNGSVRWEGGGVDVRREAMVSLRSDRLHVRQARYFEERTSVNPTRITIRWSPIQSVHPKRQVATLSSRSR